jgi:hypothetical protein
MKKESESKAKPGESVELQRRRIIQSANRARVSLYGEK